MNKVGKVLRKLRSKGQVEQINNVSENEKREFFNVEKRSGNTIETEKNICKLNFEVPKILEYFPEIYENKAMNSVSCIENGVGHLVCGTISSYFEDTWKRSVNEYRKSELNSSSSVKSGIGFGNENGVMSRTASYYGLGTQSRTNSFSGLGTLSRSGSFSGIKIGDGDTETSTNRKESEIGREMGIYLKREWHRLWLVRSFLSFCWENYLEDLLELSSFKRKHYLSLPCYGTNLVDLKKIPLGEIMCIVISSMLVFSINEKRLQVPFSTVQGNVINKITLRVDKKRHWRTPPPNSVARFRIHGTDKSEFTDIHMSLDIDRPELLWRRTLPESIPKEFNNLYVISSCVRVLRKGEIGKFVTSKSGGSSSNGAELVLELLDWYCEKSIDLVYGCNKKAECRYFIVGTGNGPYTGFGKENVDFDNYNVEYCVTSNDKREKAVFSTKNSTISKSDVDSNLINAALRENNRVVVYLTSELLSAELSVLNKSLGTSKLISVFKNALTGILTGNKKYFLHLERKGGKSFRESGLLRSNMLLLNHITGSRKQFESRLKLLEDLRRFAELVLSKVEIAQGKSMIVEDVLFKELSETSSGLVENLRIRFEKEVFSKNLFNIPFILLEHQRECEDEKGNEVIRNFIYFISPCIKSENELLYYTIFKKFVSNLREDSKSFNVISLENNNLLPNTLLGNRSEDEIMGLSHYEKGVSMIREIGGFEFDIPQNKITELSSIHNSLHFLNDEIREISADNIEGKNGFFNYIIRTCFYALHSEYSSNNVGNCEDLCVSDGEDVYVGGGEEFSDNFNYNELQKLIVSETRKRSSSYYRCIGLLAEILLDINVNEKASFNSMFELVLTIGESMRHISGFCVIMNYILTWVLIQIQESEVCHSDWLKKGNLGDLLTIHRICREFVKTHRSEIARGTLENMSTRYLEYGILRTDLPLIDEPKHRPIFKPVNYEYTTSKGNTSNGSPERFFKLLIKYDVFERLSLLLLGPVSKRVMDGRNDYYNLLKICQRYEFFSIGNNSNGTLGIGMPRCDLFTPLECKLYPVLEKVNIIYRQKGHESDYIGENLQRVIFRDNFPQDGGISSVQFGSDHVLVLRKNGTLFSWGSNKYGQCCQERRTKRIEDVLGKLCNKGKDIKGDENDKTEMEQEEFERRIQEFENIVPLPEKVTFSSIDKTICISKISCGSNFSLALDTKGNLYSWGQGKDGCLGTGVLEDSFFPRRIETGFECKIRTMASGMFHCAAIDTEDQLYVWGSNEFGQLGLQDSRCKGKIVPTPLKLNMGLIRFSESSSLDAKIIIKRNEEDIRICLLEESGDGGKGVLVKWKEISLGEVHSVALDTAGCVWVWGQNNFKQLTKVHRILSLEFVLEDWERKMTLLKRSEGNIGSEKSDALFASFPTPLISTRKQRIFDSKKISMVFSGSTCCCAIDEEGKPWIWGLTFSRVEGQQTSSYYSSSFFERRQILSSKQGKQERAVEFKEFDLPVRVFRNMTSDDDSIRLIKFGKGNNNFSMISRYGRCYLWLENKGLISQQMKFSSQHNCYVLDGLSEKDSERKPGKEGSNGTDDGKAILSHLFENNLKFVHDIALLSDSIVLVTKNRPASKF